ncbi:hypothetical protein QJS04_geneDACA012409 [Acorus gramineus]|uniref:Uncharacterized protein n=1 Tax=Acorus gramineus TaxID=55184 RepID=A0AAV9BB19_ACOGR|nr:hypothetical protein QJS04_geneDACA012409 [Acorus gramineus]
MRLWASAETRGKGPKHAEPCCANRYFRGVGKCGVNPDGCERLNKLFSLSASAVYQTHAQMDRRRRLNTTRSSQFLGLRNQQGLWSDSDYGSGVCDPSQSFSDFNLDPMPSKWKSVCEFGGSNSYLEVGGGIFKWMKKKDSSGFPVSPKAVLIFYIA